MKKEIIPTIFALDKKTFDLKLNILKEFTKIIHIDICDSKFVKTKTIQLKEINSLEEHLENINFQVHLMVENPLAYIDEILRLKIKKVFFQFEIPKKSNLELLEIKKKYEEKNIEVGLVLNPATKVDSLLSILSEFKYIMLMSVYPGAEGQEFDSKVVKKLKQIKTLFPHIYVQVDGGIKEEETKLLSLNNCNGFCVGSYITSSKNPKKNYNNLLTIVKSH